MVMHDYHKEGEKVVLLLHPMLASGEMMYHLLGRQLGENVRCLAPDFASHGAERGKEFAGASTEAEQIMAYLEQNGITHIDLAYGASLGGVVLTQLLRRKLSFTTAFFEGTSFFEGAKIMTKLVSGVFLKKHKRAVADHERAVKAMGALYGEAYAQEFADQFISMSDNSIRKIAESCGDNRHADLTAEEQSRCIFAYGSKDMNVPEAKKKCKKVYPKSKLVFWEGYDHCERVVADTDGYVRMLSAYLNGGPGAV